MSQLNELYQINDTNLALRKQFIGLTAKDVQVLKQLASWSKRVAEPLALEFYTHQFSFPATVEFFEQYARRKELPLETLRHHLEQKQAGYFRQIFEEAAQGGQFETAYFERRLKVGQLHNVIELPVKWYLGSYVYYQDLVRKYLLKSFWFRPVFRAAVPISDRGRFRAHGVATLRTVTPPPEPLLLRQPARLSALRKPAAEPRQPAFRVRR